MYTHLHRHSEWSTLDGLGTSEQYAERAAVLGQPALGQTDHGTLSGILHHIRACQAHGLFPICGVEAYFKPDRSIKDADHRKNWHLTLLAKSLRGWHTLMALTSAAWDSGFYHKPCVDWDLLERHHEDLIAMTACIGGWLCHQIRLGSEDKAYIHRMRKIFGDDLYVEIMPHDTDEQRQVNLPLINIASDYSIPLVATVDAHVPYQEWSDTHEVLWSIATNTSRKQRKAKKAAGEEVYGGNIDTLYLMSEDEVRQTFAAHHPEIPASVVASAMNVTQDIVKKMKPWVIDRSFKLPKLDVSESAETIVKRWCEDGMQRIGKADDPLYRERLDYELGVLEAMGVYDYFAILGDVLAWCRKQGVRYGAARGSSAGSLVSYLCQITALDPITHELLFERFLNPDRVGLPDIDIDFQASKRDQVKAYLAERFGAENVADIIAFQTYGVKSAIKSVAHALDVSFPETNRVTDALDDSEDGATLDTLADVEPLKTYADKYEEVMYHARRLYGQVKAVSQHAAGMVITPGPVRNFIPTQRAKGGAGDTVTAFGDRVEFSIVSDFGFLKYDFLGIVGLDKQEWACDTIERDTGQRPDLNALDVCRDPALADPEVLRMFREGRTLGIFQFEGRGITQLLKQIKPDRFLDIVIANALFRPGPLQGGMAYEYGKRKHGKSQIDYFHPKLEAILKPTLGLLVFQEQIMLAAEALAGYSRGEADLIRKAVAKLYRDKTGKARAQLVAQGEEFCDRASQLGVDRVVATRVWEQVVEFADYGFNRSHAAAYSVQAFQDGWLKVHGPLAFYGAELTRLATGKPEDKLKIARAVREMQGENIRLLGPDINRSSRGFDADAGAVRVGLLTVAHVGDVAYLAISEARQDGPFVSVDDFRSRVKPRKCNSQAVDCLVAAGAFDCFGERDGWSNAEMAACELETLKFTYSGLAPVERYRKLIHDCLDLEARRPMVGGEITAVREITDRKHNRMAFMELAFEAHTFDITCFSSEWAEFSPICQLGAIVLINGKMDDGGSILVDNIATCDAVQAELEAEVAGAAA